MTQLLFVYIHRTGECPSFISSCQFEKRSKRWIASISDSKEDGCTVIAVVFTRSHPEPGSQAHLRQFWYCGARAHGNVCHCASLLSLGKISPQPLLHFWSIGPGRIPYWSAAFSNLHENTSSEGTNYYQQNHKVNRHANNDQ